MKSLICLKQFSKEISFLFSRTTLRHWDGSPYYYSLLIGIVALGVGSFNAIRQASRSACEDFGLFNRALSGASDYIIQSKSESIQESDLNLITDLNSLPGLHLIPVIEGSAVIVDNNSAQSSRIQIVGVDPISISNLPQQEGLIDLRDGKTPWYSTISDSRRVWIGPQLARKYSISIDDSFSILSGGRLHEISVRNIIPDPQNLIPDDLVIADVTVVQNLLSRTNEIDRIEVFLNDLASREDTRFLDSQEQAIRSKLPPSLVIGPTSNRLAERSATTAAFRLNLTILSLIAILVGAYLILQALDASVIRRRSEVAILISLGVQPRNLFCLQICEATLIGFIGSAIGIGLGHLMSYAAVGMVSETVNALYYKTSSNFIVLEKTDILIGLLLGTCFSVISGWLPARDAMQTPPAQVLKRGNCSLGVSWLSDPKYGILLIFSGTILAFLQPIKMAGGGNAPVGGFLAAGCWIFGCAFLSGQVLVWVSSLLKGFSANPAFVLAISRLKEGSSRHRLAVAGLVVATGMVTGMYQMTNSFSRSITEWFEVRFQADLFISERGLSGSASMLNGIDPKVLESLLQNETIAYADVFYSSQVRASESMTTLAGIDFKAWENRVDQIWLKPPGSLTVTKNSEPAYVSEAFARRFGVFDGGSVQVSTRHGDKLVSPVGIFADYGNEFGTAAIDKTTWMAWTDSARPTNVSLFLKPDSFVNEIRDEMRLAFPGLEIRNQNELKQVALKIFNQTFSSTRALIIIGLSVAFLGLALGLFSIFEESKSTWKTLRYLGFSNRQLVLIAGLEGGLVGLTSWFCGTVLGIAIGLLLVHVINVQSFGWTLIWSPSATSILLFGLLLVSVGFLCGCLSSAIWHTKNKNL